MTEKQELINENQNSITLKKDSKGQYNWDIKIYFNDGEGAVIEKIKSIDAQLKGTYGGQ